MRPRLIAISDNGKSVSFYSDSSAGRLFEANSQLKRLAASAIRTLTLDPNRPLVEFDFGRVIGTSSLVETSAEDQIVYAKRSEQQGYARFVRGRQQPDCTKLALVFRAPAHPGHSYLLVSTWIGHLAPPFPSHYRSNERWAEFWSRHALVWGSQPVMEGTETSYCPW